ncbi:MAG: adenylyl-sulfate kinase, partial [Acidobacteria bacterium]|nr:adenylyl-sulfate kinase [Acidobacteriota bacterium]
CVVWLTGLSGCGKSTNANLVDQMLHQCGPTGDRDAVPKRQA